MEASAGRVSPKLPMVGLAGAGGRLCTGTSAARAVPTADPDFLSGTCNCSSAASTYKPPSQPLPRFPHLSSNCRVMKPSTMSKDREPATNRHRASSEHAYRIVTFLPKQNTCNKRVSGVPRTAWLIAVHRSGGRPVPDTTLIAVDTLKYTNQANPIHSHIASSRGQQDESDKPSELAEVLQIDMMHTLRIHFENLIMILRHQTICRG